MMRKDRILEQPTKKLTRSGTPLCQCLRKLCTTWKVIHQFIQDFFLFFLDVDKIEDLTYRIRLQNLFDENTLGPVEEKVKKINYFFQEFAGDDLLAHPKTLKVLNNTAEFIMRYQDDKKNCANMWMMCGSRLNEISDDVDFARALSLIAILNSEQENVIFRFFKLQYITSEGLFNAAKDMLSDVLSFITKRKFAMRELKL